MERDQWKCRRCGDGENTLTVHHGYYSKGKKLWDYPNDTLFTLCKYCHEEIQNELGFVHYLLACECGLYPFNFINPNHHIKYCQVNHERLL